MNTSPSPELSQFASDVLAGLSASPKHLSSKYFYDDEGTRLFQEIMKLPEYYLTGCEEEIFLRQSEAIFSSFADGGNSFELVELGAGDGTKTAILIDHFIKQKADISYSPIDISSEALGTLSDKFTSAFPGLSINARQGDYLSILGSLSGDLGTRKVLLFLGSNIGNFSRENSISFFRGIRDVMGPNDQLFIGFDLKKDPRVILRAYDDPAGITAAFNLNLLTRINSELGGTFDVSKFEHYAIYHPGEGSAMSYLVSRERQKVHIAALGRTFEFGEWEPVFTEISQKYDLSSIKEIAAESGFEVERNFFDSRRYYCDSLWKKR